MKFYSLFFLLASTLIYAQNYPTTVPPIPKYMQEIQTEEQVPDFEMLDYMYVPVVVSRQLWQDELKNPESLKRVTTSVNPQEYWTFRHSIFEKAMRQIGLWDKREQLENYFRVMMIKGPTPKYRKACFEYFVYTGQIMTPKTVQAIQLILNDPEIEAEKIMGVVLQDLISNVWDLSTEPVKPNNLYLTLPAMYKLLDWLKLDYEKTGDVSAFAPARAAICNALKHIYEDSSIELGKRQNLIIEALNKINELQKYLIEKCPDNVINVSLAMNIAGITKDEYLTTRYIENVLPFFEQVDYSKLESPFTFFRKLVFSTYSKEKITERTDSVYFGGVAKRLLEFALNFEKNKKVKFETIVAARYYDAELCLKLTEQIYNKLMQFSYDDLSLMSAVNRTSITTFEKSAVPALVWRILNFDQTKVTDKKNPALTNVMLLQMFNALDTIVADSSLKKELGDFNSATSNPEKIKSVVTKWWAENEEKYPLPTYDPRFKSTEK